MYNRPRHKLAHWATLAYSYSKHSRFFVVFTALASFLWARNPRSPRTSSRSSGVYKRILYIPTRSASCDSSSFPSSAENGLKQVNEEKLAQVPSSCSCLLVASYTASASTLIASRLETTLELSYCTSRAEVPRVRRIPLVFSSMQGLKTHCRELLRPIGTMSDPSETHRDPYELSRRLAGRSPNCTSTVQSQCGKRMNLREAILGLIFVLMMVTSSVGFADEIDATTYSWSTLRGRVLRAELNHYDALDSPVSSYRQVCLPLDALHAVHQQWGSNADADPGDSQFPFVADDPDPVGNPCFDDLYKFYKGEPPFDGVTRINMLSSFGRGFGDLGDFRLCQQVHIAKYAWLARRDMYDVRAGMGMCVPKVCNPEDLPKSVGFLLKAWFNLTIADDFLVAQTLYSVEPDLKFFVGVALLSIALLLALFATVLHLASLRHWHLWLWPRYAAAATVAAKELAGLGDSTSIISTVQDAPTNLASFAVSASRLNSEGTLRGASPRGSPGTGTQFHRSAQQFSGVHDRGSDNDMTGISPGSLYSRGLSLNSAENTQGTPTLSATMRSSGSSPSQSVFVLNQARNQNAHGKTATPNDLTALEFRVKLAAAKGARDAHAHRSCPGKTICLLCCFGCFGACPVGICGNTKHKEAREEEQAQERHLWEMKQQHPTSSQKSAISMAPKPATHHRGKKPSRASGALHAHNPMFKSESAAEHLRVRLLDLNELAMPELPSGRENGVDTANEWSTERRTVCGCCCRSDGSDDDSDSISADDLEGNDYDDDVDDDDDDDDDDADHGIGNGDHDVNESNSGRTETGRSTPTRQAGQRDITGSEGSVGLVSPPVATCAAHGDSYEAVAYLTTSVIPTNIDVEDDSDVEADGRDFPMTVGIAQGRPVRTGLETSSWAIPLGSARDESRTDKSSTDSNVGTNQSVLYRTPTDFMPQYSSSFGPRRKVLASLISDISGRPSFAGSLGGGDMSGSTLFNVPHIGSSIGGTPPVENQPSSLSAGSTSPASYVSSNEMSRVNEATHQPTSQAGYHDTQRAPASTRRETPGQDLTFSCARKRRKKNKHNHTPHAQRRTYLCSALCCWTNGKRASRLRRTLSTDSERAEHDQTLNQDESAAQTGYCERLFCACVSCGTRRSCTEHRIHCQTCCFDLVDPKTVPMAPVAAFSAVAGMSELLENDVNSSAYVDFAVRVRPGPWDISASDLALHPYFGAVPLSSPRLPQHIKEEFLRDIEESANSSLYRGCLERITFAGHLGPASFSDKHPFDRSGTTLAAEGFSINGPSNGPPHVSSAFIPRAYPPHVGGLKSGLVASTDFQYDGGYNGMSFSLPLGKSIAEFKDEEALQNSVLRATMDLDAKQSHATSDTLGDVTVQESSSQPNTTGAMGAAVAGTAAVKRADFDTAAESSTPVLHEHNEDPSMDSALKSDLAEESEDPFNAGQGSAYAAAIMAFKSVTRPALPLVWRLFGEVRPQIEPPNTQCLHGFRVAAFAWALLGSTYLYFAPFMSNSAYFSRFVARRVEFQIVSSSQLASECFLLMSSFLWTYGFLVRSERYQNKVPWTMLPLARFMRLMPAIFAVLVLHWLISPLFASGPLWVLYCNAANQCNHGYWQVLFAQNFVSPFNLTDSSCLSWTWQIALDVQMFLVSLPILYLSTCSKRVAAGVATALAIASAAVTFVIALQWDMSINAVIGGERWQRYLTHIMLAPWTRLKTAMIGFLAALAYDHFHRKRIDLLREQAQNARKSVLDLMSKDSQSTVQGTKLALLDRALLQRSSQVHLNVWENMANVPSPSVQWYHSTRETAALLTRSRVEWVRNAVDYIDASLEDDENLDDGGIVSAASKADRRNVDEWLQSKKFTSALKKFASNRLQSSDSYLDFVVCGIEVPINVTKIIAVVVCMMIIVVTVLAPYESYSFVNEDRWPAINLALYLAFGVSFYVMALATLIVMASLGLIPFLSGFFSLQPFRFLSKLTYSAYLVHPLIVHGVYASSGSTLFYSDVYILSMFLTFIALTFAGGLIMYLVVERPVRRLANYYLERIYQPVTPQRDTSPRIASPTPFSA